LLTARSRELFFQSEAVDRINLAIWT